MGGGDDTDMQATPRRARRSRWHWLWKLPLVLVALSVLQVVVLRFVDPPFSTYMAIRQVDAWTGRDEPVRLRYSWRDWNGIAPSLPLAVVASEDQNFGRHRGFDFDAIEQARAHNARGGRMRGASTISQQVARNVFLWGGRSWVRKGLEAWYTVLVETIWSKQRILEVYVNVAEFGDGIYGAQAAAREFFGKDAAQLSALESARLAAVLPSPRRYSATRPGPYVQRRTVQIERQMRQIGGEAHLQQFD